LDRCGQRQLGQRLETVVALELWPRGCSASYGLTPEREEVDVVVLDPLNRRLDLPAGVRLIPALEWLLELGCWCRGRHLWGFGLGSQRQAIGAACPQLAGELAAAGPTEEHQQGSPHPQAGEHGDIGEPENG
jgi:hypothetical protein